MTQTVTITTSTAVTPVLAPGNVRVTQDNAILVGVWSTGITVTDDSVFTATPGTAGTILVQFSGDAGTTWFNAAAAPYSRVTAGGVPPGVNRIRATATVATATLSVATPEPGTIDAADTTGALVTTGGTAVIPGVTQAVAVEALGRRTLLCATIGDSIEASYYNPGVSTTLFNLGEQCMLTWAQRWSLGAMRITQNLAVSGARLAAMLTQADGLDGSARIVIENGGVNDLVGDNASISYCLGLKAALWAKLRAKGYEVLSISVSPVDSTGGGSLAKNQKIIGFNNSCDDLAAKYGVIRSNPARVMINPADANGYPRANYTFDGLHPSVLGGYYEGKIIWSDLDAAFPGSDYQLATSPLDGYAASTLNNVWSENALFTGAGGTLNGQGGAGASGVVSDGMDVSAFGTASVVCSVISDPDGFGSALQLVISGGAANDRVEVRRSATTATPAALNDTISFECVVRVTAGTTIGAVVPWILVQAGGNFYAYGGSGSNPGPTPYLTGGTPAEDLPWLIQVPPFTAQNLAGTATVLTALRDFVGIYVSGAGASTVVLSRKRGRKIVLG